MIQIESHIEKLLLSHDCVIVPGIGGFVTRFEGSYVDGDEICPPYRSVSFNSQLKDNDGLLAQSYMAAYDTSYPRAQSLVEENVKEIRHSLHERGEYEFKNIGKLQLAQNQSLIFSPINESGLFSKDHYGLSPCMIDMQAFNNCSVSLPEQKDSVHNTNSFGEAQNPEVPAENRNKPFRTSADNSHYIIRISKNVVRNAVASIAAALLYFIFTIAPSSNPINPDNIQEAAIVSTLRTNVTDEDKNVSTNAVNPPSHSKESPQKAYRNASDDNNKTVTADKVTDHFTIVVASAISQTGGENLVEKLKKNKFNDAQFIRDGKMNRVILSSYTSKKEACDALNKLRKTDDTFSSAWVMRR